MFLHIGEGVSIPQERIIGIFDLDRTSCSGRTRDYLKHAEEEGVVINAGDGIPRSFVTADHPYHTQIVYLSQLSPETLVKRAAEGLSEQGGTIG